MKVIRFTVFLLILTGIVPNLLHSQAIIQKDFAWYLQTKDGIYPATETMAVFTPSGNILHKQSFMLPAHDSLVPERGVNKVSFRTRVLYNGTLWEMVNVEGHVYPDGKCSVTFHLNGAGFEVPAKKGKM